MEKQKKRKRDSLFERDQCLSNIRERTAAPRLHRDLYIRTCVHTLFDRIACRWGRNYCKSSDHDIQFVTTCRDLVPIGTMIVDA